MVTGTMTEASHLLRTSQPAVSRLISELERTVGLKLFDRRHGRVAPTSEGLRLFEIVERSFISLDSILQSAADIKDFRDAQIIVAAMPALCLDIVPLVVNDFLRQYPNARVAVHARSSRHVVDWMIAQQADIGLATPPFDLQGVSGELIIESPCVCLIPSNHRLVQKDTICPEDLDSERMILLSNSLIRHNLDRAFSDAGIRLLPSIETPLSIVAARHVELGIGIAIVEPYTAAYCVDRNVVVRPFIPHIPFTYALLKPESRKESAAVLEFKRMLRQRLVKPGLPYHELSTVRDFGQSDHDSAKTC